MKPGDVGYVGPGLYREHLRVQRGGEAGRRVTFVADPMGRTTGDPPGLVLVTGADPVDERAFSPGSGEGVWTLEVDRPVLGVVEMDGPQHRYRRARETREHLREGRTLLETVARRPSTFYYDEESRRLFLHTSDGAPPSSHEIEVIVRGYGIGAWRKPFVTVIGFTFRHMGDAGVSFFHGSHDGVALDNVSWGSRQGIRVYASRRVLVSGNTLFRNENSGVYFAARSSDGVAIGNVTYENVKGLRWSSGSNGGVALGNWAFGNRTAGIAVERTEGVVVRRNALVANGETPLFRIEADPVSSFNCIEPLDDFRRSGNGASAASVEGCGERPPKVDVAAVHAATTGAAETPVPDSGTEATPSWWRRLFDVFRAP